MSDHKCFGCGRDIGNGQPHIHVGIDEWGQRNGMAAIGLGGDDLVFPFCEPCTVTTGGGWQLEAHDVGEDG